MLYDHDAIGGKAEAHVVFGEAQGKRSADLIKAMNKSPVEVARIKGQQGEYGTGQYEKGQNEFLQPLIDTGKVKVVCEQYTQNWDPTLAQSFAEDCLTRNGGDVDVFIAMNDGTAGGAVAALINQGLKPGQKLVTGGQNAEAEALRYIAQGWLDELGPEGSQDPGERRGGGRGLDHRPKGRSEDSRERQGQQPVHGRPCGLPARDEHYARQPLRRGQGRGVDLGGYLQGHRDDRRLQEEPVVTR